MMKGWVNCDWNEMGATEGHVLWVADGLYGHYTAWLPGEERQDILEAYAQGYEAGEAGKEIRVGWTEFLDGEEVEDGEWVFLSEQ